jgi:hypothetical protein
MRTNTRSFVRGTAWWTLLAPAVAVLLSACLTSDPPKLKRDDLVQVQGLVGDYTATALPEGAPDQPQAIAAHLEAEKDGSYLLTFIEGDHTDAPTRLRLLQFKPTVYLCVMTESEPRSSAMYAFVTGTPDGQWAFKVIDLLRDQRTDRIQPIFRRHGASKVTFEDLGSNPATTADHIEGNLSARQLRALFVDPDFVAVTQTDSGFRLTPKH